MSRLIPAELSVILHADLGGVEWPGVQDHIRDSIDEDLAVVRANQTLLCSLRICIERRQIG